MRHADLARDLLHRRASSSPRGHVPADARRQLGREPASAGPSHHLLAELCTFVARVHGLLLSGGTLPRPQLAVTTGSGEDLRLSEPAGRWRKPLATRNKRAHDAKT